MMYLTQGLHRSLQQRRDAVATIMDGRRRSWFELGERVSRLAAGLISLGVRSGDHVAVIAHNSDRYIELYLAVWWAGAVIVPGNTRWALAEHVYALRDSEARFLFVDRTFAGLAPELKVSCRLDDCVYLDDGDAPLGMSHSEDLIRSCQHVADACGRDDELAALFYTGGTTGQAKGVMLSHRNLVSNCISALETTRFDDETRFLHSPPMYHLADVAMMLGLLMTGGTHVVVPYFSPEFVARAITDFGVTSLLLVPTMFGMLARHVEWQPTDFSSVTNVIYGASPVSEATLKQAMSLFPNAKFRQCYGQTELSPIATTLTEKFHTQSNTGKSYLRSAGRAIVGVDVKIVDDEMNDLPAMEVGEIAVRSPGMMLGYWKQPELSAKTIVDGWLRTGDAGYMDEEGFVHLVDRMKDMVISGGENIYSAEVENALSSHPDVLECAVIGIPDERWGEAVHAVVRLKDGVRASADDLIAHCRKLIAGYKIPKSIQIRRDPLPLSGVGKIRKTELRRPFWEGKGANIS